VASFVLANDLASLHSVASDLLTIVGNAQTPTVSTSVAVLFGDADRFPLALEKMDAALGVFAGPIATKGLTDVGAFYGDAQAVTKNGAGIAFSPAADNAQGDLEGFTSVTVKGPVLGSSAGGPSGGGRVSRYLANASVPIATGDVDGDGLIETFVVDGNVSGAAAKIQKVSVSGASPGLALLVAAPQRFGVAGKLQLTDVDGDGALDLVYISGFEAVTPGRAPGESTSVKGDSVMTIFWNQGGALATTGVPLGTITIDNAKAAPAECATLSNPTGIASIRVAAGAPPSVALLTARCLYVTKISRAGTGSGRWLPTNKTTPETPLTICFSIVAGDLSGDGVDEIALLDDRNLTVLSQAPVRP
jgi:hypothetical protein